MDYVQVISNVGFPIFVAVYLLVRVERVVNKNTEAIKELCRVITVFISKG
jgi:hypothetical protein